MIIILTLPSVVRVGDDILKVFGSVSEHNQCSENSILFFISAGDIVWVSPL